MVTTKINIVEYVDHFSADQLYYLVKEGPNSRESIVYYSLFLNQSYRNRCNVRVLSIDGNFFIHSLFSLSYSETI